MSVKALLQELQDNNIEMKLGADGGLQLSLSKVQMDNTELINRIKDNKSKIIASLQEEQLRKELENARMTPFQEGLVSFVKGNAAGNRYVIQLTYETDTPLIFDALYKSCDLVVLRHDLLRSTFDFDVQEGIFRMRLLTEGYLNCKQIGLAEEAAFRNEYFDISAEPLIKFTLVGDRRLIITIHHLIIDVNSIHILLKELFDCYKSMATGAPLPTLDKPVQFSSYVKWLLGQDKENARSYWRELLKNCTPTLLENIAINEAVTKTATYKELKFQYELEEDIVSYLRSKRLTVSTVLNFIGGLVLSKYYGSRNFVWGNTITHRYFNHADFANIVGPCISTIPLSVAFVEDKSMFDAILAFHDQLINSREYSYLSLNEIYSAAKTEQLFSVLFSFQDMSDSSRLAEISGGIRRIVAENEVTSHFPFALLATQFDRNLEFMVNYRNDLFPDNFAKDVTDLIMSVFNNIKVMGQRNLLDFSLFEDVPVVKTGVLSGEKVAVGERGLLQLFGDGVKMNPDKIALEDYNGNVMTYQELDHRSNYVAGMLKAAKVQGAVGLYLNYNVNIVVSILGILKAGCHFVSLEQGFPHEKLVWLAQQAKLQACIISEDSLLSDDLPELCIKLRLPDNIPSIEEDVEWVVARPDELCALYYTSGSTGVPKVVKTSHLNTLNGLSWLKQHFPADQHDVFCLNVRLSFSPATRNIFEALSQGAKLLVIPEFLYHNTDKFTRFVNDKKASRISLTPSFIRVLIENDKMGDLQQIKLLEIRGEAVRMSDIRRIKEVLPHAILLNRYGATEASSTSYNYQFESDRLEFYPLGKPVHNTVVTIVDDNLKVKPKNVVGEILIESKSLSLGYLNGSDNAGVFIPGGVNEGDSRLRTGDYGFVDDQDILHYIGRKNRMIKIRGFRIEPSEIEYNLEQFTGVETAVVIATDTDYGTRLTAFCLVKNEAEFTEVNLKHFLKEKVPAYMIPNRIMLLTELPRTSTGKVDLMRLQELVKGTDNKESGTPSTLTEKRVYNIFKRLMPEVALSVKEDFYSQGVDSILAMRAVYNLEREFSVKLKGVEMFEYDSITKLSEYLDQIMSNEDHQRKENYHKLNFKETNTDTLFLIPPLTGNSTFRMLQPFVPEDLDFVVFDTIEPHEYDTLGKDMETLAGFYKNSILQIAKEKTIHLAGWSFGASLCFEVAVQLAELGYKIPSLILLDPTFYNPEFDHDNKQKEDYMKILCSLLEEAGIDPDEFDTSKIIEQMYHANQVSKKHRLKKYDGNIFLIKPESVSSFERNYNKPYNGLEEYCTGEITVSWVKGNHLTMTTGPAKFFADNIFTRIVRS